MNSSVCLQCDHCSFQSSKRFILERHIITCHINGTSQPKSSKCNISCELCDVLFHSRDDLINHLTSVHNKKIVTETLNFSSVNEFKSWKKGIEAENHCRYIQQSGAKKFKKKSVVVKYFYCHRDGKVRFRAPEPRKRRIKSQGSNKINNACPSKIIYKVFGSGTIEVTFVSTHIGHDDNIGRLALTEDEKAIIAGKLKVGVPFDEILDVIYNSVHDINSPIALTEKQQLRNIVRDFDLNPWKAHSNDAISVDVWFTKVASVNEEALNPVLFYKRQGENFIDNRLTAEDIVLVIANQFQKEMLLKFGNGIVCTDTTHGVNQYDFHLTTLLVVDEYGNGIPVAFLISNRKDADTFSVFYEIVKTNIGDIHPNVFMTDDDPAFYNAWIKVMGPVPHRLLCAWHVDKSWRTNLQSKIVDLKTRAIVYKALRVLLQVVDIAKFKILLHNFVLQSLADPNTKSFAEYFKTYYANRPECWAYCYRRDCHINTNMRLESVHKIVKYFYLNREKNKRLDRCIDALMKFTRDCSFRRLRKLAKKKRPALVQNVLASHQKAVTSDWNQYITNADDNFPNMWHVQSFTNSEINYVVELLQPEIRVCGNNCLVICEECTPKICIHTFSCDCIDYLIKSNICKHIHSVVLYLSTPAPKEIVVQQPVPEEEIVILKPFIESTTAVNDNEYAEKLRTKAETVLGYLTKPKTLSTLSEKEYLELNRPFDRQLNILGRKLQRLKPMKTSEGEPANKNIEKQKRLELFRSTKKKREKNNNCNELRKPTTVELNNLDFILENEHLLH